MESATAYYNPQPSMVKFFRKKEPQYRKQDSSVRAEIAS